MVVGRIVFEGEEIESYQLKDVDGAVLFEVVDGQYRIERLDDEADTKEKN